MGERKMSDHYIVPQPIAIKIRNVNPMWAREYYNPIDEYSNVLASTPMWSTLYPVMASYPIHNVNPYPYTVHQRAMAEFHPFMSAGYMPTAMSNNDMTASYPNTYRSIPLHEPMPTQFQNAGMRTMREMPAQMKPTMKQMRNQ